MIIAVFRFLLPLTTRGEAIIVIIPSLKLEEVAEGLDDAEDLKKSV